MKCWILLITKRLFRRKERILILVASTMLLIIIGMFLYLILSNLIGSLDNMDESTPYGDHLGNHTIFYKFNWKGRRCTKENRMPHPVGLVIISHTTTGTCSSLHTCGPILRSIQDRHMNKGLYDIAVNFAIGGDGNIYVGRGWDASNHHTHVSVGISFIGNYEIDTLNDNMVNATHELLKQGVNLGKISKDYALIGYNQTCKSVQKNPGENVYKEIKKWEHYSSLLIIDNDSLDSDKEAHQSKTFYTCEYF